MPGASSVPRTRLRSVPTRLTPGAKWKQVRLDKTAESFGAHGEYVERAEDIGPAVERALASGKPAIIHVVIDAEVTSSFAGVPGFAEFRTWYGEDGDNLGLRRDACRAGPAVQRADQSGQRRRESPRRRRRGMTRFAAPPPAATTQGGVVTRAALAGRSSLRGVDDHRPAGPIADNRSAFDRALFSEVAAKGAKSSSDTALSATASA